MGNLCGCCAKESSTVHKGRTEGNSAPSAQPSKNFAQELLNSHNIYRVKHRAPPMTLNDKLNRDAQKWANYIAGKDTLKHADAKDREGAGENLAWGSAGLSPQECADMWYDEIKDYKFSQPGFHGNTGHFTQLIWKSSIEFGAGIAKSSTGATFVVGRYFPAGNVNTVERFKENVLPEK